MFLCRHRVENSVQRVKIPRRSWGLLWNAKAWWSDKSICLNSAFPSLFTYGIWWARNTTTFNNKMIPPEVTAALVIQWTREHISQVKDPKFRVLVPPEINKGIPWAFFDGESQGDIPLGGLGAILYLPNNPKIQAKYVPGHCTNNKAELATLHLFLELALNNNITQMQVFGDSKMVVDWVIGGYK